MPAGPAAPRPKPVKQRYFPGRAPQGAPVDSESDSDDEEEQIDLKPKRAILDENSVAGGAGKVVQVGNLKGKPQMKVALRDVKVEDGRVLLGGEDKAAVEESSSGEDETDSEDEGAAPVASTSRVNINEESSEYESGSEEESSEEEKKPVYRPTFVPKKARETVKAREEEEAEAIETVRREEEAREQRRMDSKLIAGETIRRELAEKEALEIVPDVDDTDGLDSTGEFEDWRARELARMLRDQQAAAERDAELAEIEKRRALPEDQRLREDEAYAQKTRDDKPKGERAFMEKYYHKGAFHQDDDLLKRDYSVQLESTVDVTLLPKIMQKRNFGKMSQSKYTHLADQDTTGTGWGAAARPTPMAGQGGFENGCFNCGGPHLKRDCPNPPMDPTRPPGMQQQQDGGGGNRPFGTSANGSALGGGSRGWGDDKYKRYDEQR